MTLSERVALYLVADVFLVTSLREGLNLQPLEYIYARKDLSHAGVVVASEFSTCSSLLSGSLRVNPFYTLSFISSHPSALWTRQIIGDLKHLDTTRNRKKSRVNVPEPLDLEYILEAYETARDVGLTPKGTRVFIFDYGGTLLHKEKIEIYMKTTVQAISGSQPTKEMLSYIRLLSDDPRNCVVIITGLTRLKLGDTFKGFKNVTLVTSNGLVYSWAENMSQNSTTGVKNMGYDRDDVIDDEGRLWQCFDFNVDWKSVCDIAIPIIQKYTFRTNGSCVSPRVPGVGWSYYGADPEWGEKQAQQLGLDL
eukprot:GSChrysophyteH1.ASY1.ANO1.77.1 assembled CDS